jgi:LPPG:FO 2-phospho-L-lactate transferase
LPMTDAPVATLLDTSAGQLEFQHYFVRLRTIPAVQRLHYAGAAQARPSDDLLTLLRSRSLEAIILCPSNPYLSIDPILAVPGIRAALRAAAVPIVAVSPLVGGRAVKGPTAKIMQELGIETSALAIARHYAGLIDGLLVDEADASAELKGPMTDEFSKLGIVVGTARTLMRTLEDRQRLAESALDFSRRLQSKASLMPPKSLAGGA